MGYLFIFTYREDLLKAKVQNDWRDISDYFSVTFNSFAEINAAFRVSFIVINVGLL